MIEEGRAALRAGDASRARDAFERALEETESGAVLKGLGLALYLQRWTASRVNADVTSPAEVFGPENIELIMSQSGPVNAMQTA